MTNFMDTLRYLQEVIHLAKNTIENFTSGLALTRIYSDIVTHLNSVQDNATIKVCLGNSSNMFPQHISSCFTHGNIVEHNLFKSYVTEMEISTKPGTLLGILTAK
jgi:hypothetical protein